MRIFHNRTSRKATSLTAAKSTRTSYAKKKKIIIPHVSYHKHIWNIDNVYPVQILAYLEKIAAWGEG